MCQSQEVGITLASMNLVMKSSRGPQIGSAVRLGIVPLCDCAPVAVAQEMGIFQRRGVGVKISKELGWASVRDKIFYGELDAAQSIVGIAMALGLGIQKLQCEVVVPLILSLHGNAITLSNELDPRKIGDGAGLKDFLEHSWKRQRPLTLAVPHRLSSHRILLNEWLSRNGLFADERIEIVFLPPRIMSGHLEAKLIDGYCVGEPWNSKSILKGIGWSPATSGDLSHGHPEKALVVCGRFLQEHPEKIRRLAASLIEACALCEDPDFSNELISILSRKEYVGVDAAILRESFSWSFRVGSKRIRKEPFYLFGGDAVNRPTSDKASWYISGLRKVGLLNQVEVEKFISMHREDLYEEALQECGTA